MKTLTMIVIALAMLIALTGIVLGASQDTIGSSVQCQSDGFMATSTFANVGQGTGGITAPIGCNNTVYQTAYSENSFIVGKSIYLKNVTVSAPSQVGVTQLIKTERQIDAVGSIISDEAIMTGVVGQVPQNQTNAQRLYGSETVNKFVISGSDIMADSLTMQSTNYAFNGAQDVLLPSTGLLSHMALDSDIQALIGGTGFSTFYDSSFSQHGPLMTCNTTYAPTSVDTYQNKVTVSGNSAIMKHFTFQEQVKPPVQLLTPIVPTMCQF
jgi:hypothetical protein